MHADGRQRQQRAGPLCEWGLRGQNGERTLQGPVPRPSPGAATVLTLDRLMKTNVCLVCFLGLFHSRQKFTTH